MPFKPLAIKAVKSLLAILFVICFYSKVKSQAGASLDFDRFVSAVQAPSVSFGTNWSVEVWANCTYTNAGWYAILGQNYWFNNAGFVLAQYSGTVFVQGPQGLNIETSLTQNAWTHFALTYNNGIFAFYKNGQLVGTQIAPFTNATTPLDIGCRTQNTGTGVYNWWSGQLDEVRIWNVTRSQCDIQAYMNCEIPTSSPGLVSNYHFNQGIASGSNGAINFLTDASGNNNTAFLSGFALSGSINNWVAPGGVISGFTTAASYTPEINVTGNSVNITDGDVSPSTTDFSDFNGQSTRTFVIESIGVNTLNVGTPVFTGANASDFTVTVPPSANLAALTGSTSFEVAFTPTAGGTKTAVLNIYNSDCSESVYDFVITATATAGSALAFDGSDDIVGGSVLTTTTANVTLQAKVNWAGNNGFNQMVMYNGNSSNSGYGIYVNVAGNLSILFGGINFYPLSYTLTPNVWTSLTFILKNGVAEFYVNGSLTDNIVTGNPGIPFGGFNVGCNLLNFEIFNGKIDEVLFWDKALTQCEIQTYQNCEIPTSAPNLLANYHFNQGVDGGNNSTVTTLLDASGNSNNLTLTNFALTGTLSNWVAPSAIANGYTTAVVPGASIAVSGNGNNVPQSTATFGSNNTDFGTNAARTFSFYNAGTGTLNINTISFTGPNAAQFSVTTLPLASVTTGTTGFVITLTPTNTGVSTATVNISSNDCTNPTFSFVITASTPTASALNFDGTSDYIATLIDADSNVMPVTTWEAWVYPTDGGTADWRMIASMEDSGWDRYLAVRNGSFQMGYTTGGWDAAPVDLNQWQHVAVVYSGSNIKFYKNGIEYTFGQPEGSHSSAGNFIIGGNQFSTQLFEGKMDEVRVWNTIRTQCQIQTFMNAEITTTASGLVANYHFNQGIPSGPNTSVNTLIDAAGANTGTLTNFSLLTGSVSNWVSPSSIANGFTTSVVPTATLTLYGNGNPIPMGPTTNTTNYTDFGLATNRTFLVHNLGSGPLYVNTILFSGANASNFSVTSLPSSSIAGSSNSPFVISFVPTAVGTQSAIVNISSNDCTNPTFSFVITASTSPASALDFNNATDHITIANNAALSPTNAITVEAWVKPSVISVGGQYLIARSNDDQSNGHYGMLLANGVPSFIFYESGFFGVNSTATLSAGNWYHLAATWNGNKFKFYVNGIQEGEATSTGSISVSTSNMQLGWLGKPGSEYPSYSALDEVRIWNVARTQCEIQTFMNCEIPTTATGLVANYHFNQGIPSGPNTSVNTLIDAAGANTGTLTNFALTGAVSNWISPSSIANGFTTSIAPASNFSLTGNGNNVPMGSVTTTLNNTNFGTNTARTFSIYNAGTGTLNINAITFTGPNAGQFSVTTLPLASVTTGTMGFVITLTPTNTGISTATVNISSNDCTNPTFSFVITASTSPASALNFDGANDHITLSTSAPVPTGNSPYTLETWIKPNGFGDYGIIGWGNYGNTNEVNAFRLASGGLLINYWWGNDLLVSAPTLTNGAWHHVAATFDGSMRAIYIDGVIVANDFPSGHAVPNANNLRIGVTCTAVVCSGGPEFFNGMMDELRIWNVARTQCQIQTFMNCEIPSTATGLVANYHFNQGIPSGPNSAVTSLIDAVGANTGTLTGFSLLTGSVSNWISPSNIANDFTTSVVPTASMSITGNGNAIAAGSTAPLLSNFTDFGTASTRTFVIQRTGSGTLYVNAPVTLSGVNASDFSITAQPASSVTTGTTNFVVAFAPTALGTRSAIVVVNSSDCGTPNYSFVITATAVPAAALNFDGNDDFIDCGTLPNLDIAVGTWEAWVNLSTLAFNSRIFFKENSDGAGFGTYESFYLASSGKFQADIKIGATNYNVVSLTSPLINTWYHVAVTFDGLSLKIYINGVLEATNGLTIGLMNPGTGHLSLGASYANPASSAMKGNLDEARLWNRPLCQNEIQAQMNCELSGSESGLILYYKLNSGIASGVNTGVTNVIDIAGGDNTGTLNNATLSGLTSNWVEPGAVVSGSSCAVYTSPEINLISNATTILDGDSSPSLTDNTDFGNISTNNNIVRTYTIQNTGTATLAVTSITMSGADASSFIVGALSPASPIAGGSSAVFSITFAPTSVGTKTAMVNITNSDCDEGLYDFVLSGTSSVGAALSFDGVNDYVNCGNIISASYTKEAWIKVTNVLSDNNFLSAGTGIVGSALWAPSFAPYNYKLSAGHDATWAAVQDPVALVPGIWYHIAVTYDAPSLTMNLYKNGVLVSSASTVQPFTGTSPLQIGAFGSGFISSGSFDEVRIWNRPLCQAEIQNNMNCEIATTAPGLIANYHFNQGVANGSNTAISSLTDVSGSNNTGTLVTVAGTGTISNWVAVGGVTSGSSCSTYFTPEINLVGNGLSIPDGATTATISNHTNFSVVCVGGTLVRTFTIQNTGNANLTVSSLTMSGSNAALFSVGALTPVSPITPGSQAVFSVSFTPTSSGLKTATLDITNSDCNENPYNVVLTGSCNALPVVTANTSASVICNGQSTTLNGGGADTYTWSGGVPTITNGLAFTPSLTLSYTVSGTNTLTGCTSTNLAVQGITVNPNPTVSAVASSSVICNGASITITPANALSYTLNPGSVSGNSFTLSPSSNTSYSITGTNLNGCVSTNTAVLTITVNALPTVSATSSNSIICLGFTTSVIGLGANTYTWSGGVTNGTAFSPGSTQSYSVSGTNTLTGCTSTNLAVQTISIDPVPSVSVSVTSSAICIGSQATLVASGASTYTWNPGALTGATINPSPSSLTTYTVIGTNLAGCNSTINVLQTIDVNALPTVSASISNSVICAGGSVTVNGSGASTYSWTGSVTDGVSFAPLSSGSYSVSGTSTAGCTSTNNAVVSLTVNALPQLTLSGSTNNTCQGESATLTVSGASSYTWSTSENTNSIVISPTATTLYSVSALDINTCKNTASYTQSVIPCSANFTASALTKNISCAGKNDGQIKILSSSSYSNAAIVYNWNPASLCPANNCDSLTKLKSGIYNVTVKITYTVNASLVKTDSLVMPPIVLTDLSGACEVKIFKGVTANGDGLNDIMTIENITEFPNNKVSVYNRWGQLVYEVKGYNNLDKAWPIKGDEAKLMSNTYFYLIDLGNGTDLLKGWIEVIKN